MVLLTETTIISKQNLKTLIESDSYTTKQYNKQKMNCLAFSPVITLLLIFVRNSLDIVGIPRFS